MCGAVYHSDGGPFLSLDVQMSMSLLRLSCTYARTAGETDEWVDARTNEHKYANHCTIVCLKFPVVVIIVTTVTPTE